MTDGDTDWQGWLDRDGPALLLLARQYVLDRADAEDVVQEAFVRFWRARSRAVDTRAYLFACVRRSALEWLRGVRRRDRREGAAARGDVAAEPLFEMQLVQEDRRRQVEAALARLPAEQREVVVLKVWAGLTYPEIAAALDIPANTAASRYRYALDRLRPHLSEELIA